MTDFGFNFRRNLISDDFSFGFTLGYKLFSFLFM